MSVPADDTTIAPVPRVVLVDSRPDRRGVMRYVVETDQTHATVVGEAESSATALTVVDVERADVVILDIQMPLEEGMATIAALRSFSPDLGIVVCSFDLDQHTSERAVAEGADTCLPKPVRRSDLHAALATFGSRISAPAVC